MAFALLSRLRSKTAALVPSKPKSTCGQRAVDSRPEFERPAFRLNPTAFPSAAVIQPKLKVGEPDDKFEQEADRMADRVMKMPEALPPGTAISTTESVYPTSAIQPHGIECGRSGGLFPQRIKNETIESNILTETTTPLIQRERGGVNELDVQTSPKENDKKAELEFHSALHFNRTFSGFNPTGEPKEGESALIWWRVWNTGWKTAPEHWNRLTIYKADLCSGCKYEKDEIFRSETPAPSIVSITQQGQSEYESAVLIGMSFSAGHYDAYVELDVRDEVDEINEDNNSAFISFFVRPSNESESTIVGEEATIRTKKDPADTPQASPDSESQIRALRSGGQPLPHSARAFFEPRFDYDFTQVRVHTDARAAETAQSLQAKAFTVGRDVVFGAGQYAPGTHEGQRLIAHELTHVVQQSGADGFRVWQSDEKRGLSPRMEADWAAEAMTSQTDSAWRAAPELQAPRWTIQRDVDGGKAKALSFWTVDELKQMLKACDGGLDIWAKAKKANNDKDPEIERGSIAPFLGLTNRSLGKITLESKLNKCGAVQVLIFELTNLSRKADFDEVDCAALAGELSRAEYIWRNEKIERVASLVNEIHAFEACQDKWRCEPNERVSKPGLLYMDSDEYYAYLAATAAAHLEHYGKWWDEHYKTVYTALYFTFPVTGKSSSPPHQDLLSESQKRCGNKPRGEQVDWGQVRGEQVTENTLGVWLRIETRKGVNAKEFEQQMLGSHGFTGSQAARKYWADFMRLHFDELLKARKPAAQAP